MSTTLKAESLADALLNTQHSTIEHDGNNAVVTFQWPFDANYNNIETDAYLEYLSLPREDWYEGVHYLHVEPTHVECRRVARYALRPLNGWNHGTGNNTKTTQFSIEWRWYVVGNRNGKNVVLRSDGLRNFATEAEAQKHLIKWAKARKTHAYEQAFIEEHRETLVHLSRSTYIDITVPTASTTVGDTVRVHGHGKARLGLVVETSKTRVKVAWTTPSNPDNVTINWHKRH